MGKQFGSAKRLLKVTGYKVFSGPYIRTFAKLTETQSLLFCLHQDSDDEGNDDNNDEEKSSMKKEYSVQSPSPPAEDSEPEMTEEEKEFQLVSVTCFFMWTTVTDFTSFEK